MAYIIACDSRMGFEDNLASLLCPTTADRVMTMTTPDVAALARVTDFSNVRPPPSSNTTRVMTSHLELIQELQQLDKVPSLERLRAAQKRRTQQLKRWAVYEKEMQSKKRKADKKTRNVNSLQYEHKKHVSFAASVALLEASARNDPEEEVLRAEEKPLSWKRVKMKLALLVCVLLLRLEHAGTDGSSSPSKFTCLVTGD
ncbi:hypothetical protein D4764_04G0005160 [Takifugu flavidus]|uniref:Protein phosphatase 1 regulatory inhibitor subunit 16B n=1 Tax=Takifugu flavidus TaxID=433684 RepID=A0A5C6N4N3_9TELE|nr:hypothetical protein D4764_04G0005160 [Takifugu flavidus]